VLFACSENAIRSPMAEALARRLLGRSLYIESAGVRPGQVNPFVTTVLAEVGIDLSRHRPKTFEDLEDTSFDLIITLSPEAHHRALELTRTMAVAVNYWPTFDPTIVEGSRGAVLDAFRLVRDGLASRIRAEFTSG
jgi:protein-tyrosine-phosphatase